MGYVSGVFYGVCIEFWDERLGVFIEWIRIFEFGFVDFEFVLGGGLNMVGVEVFCY